MSFSTGDNGPVHTLDIHDDQVVLGDAKAGVNLASIPLSAYVDRPLLHTLTVKYGPLGSLEYAATNSQTGASINKYKSTSLSVGTGGT